MTETERVRLHVTQRLAYNQIKVNHSNCHVNTLTRLS